MRVIPVVDLQAGRVVHAVAGQRQHYAPLRSPLCRDGLPETLAGRLADQFGATTVYVADLDALGGGTPDWASYAAFTRRGLRLWLDAGLTGRDSVFCRELGGWSDRLECVLAATETLHGLAGLRTVVEVLGPHRVALSLDLREGELLAPDGTWPTPTPLGVVDAAAGAGVRRFVVLDLAAVGRRLGPTTLSVCEAIRGRVADAEIVSGGGVRDAADLHRLRASGCDAALVASALHDGRIGPSLSVATVPRDGRR